MNFSAPPDSCQTVILRVVEHMATENATEPVEVFTLDPLGDTTLITKTWELRVSSKVLSDCSPVFKAMFQPSFREGAELAKDGTCTIPLPEDEPVALHQLCAVLHSPNESIEVLIGEPRFLHIIATLIDKYQCAEAMYRWSRFALGNQIHHEKLYHNASDCLHLLSAAYNMNVPCQFNAITHYLVWSQDNQLQKDEQDNVRWEVDKEIEAPLPDELLGEILPRSDSHLPPYSGNLTCMLILRCHEKRHHFLP